jgi:hypothetical protein
MPRAIVYDEPAVQEYYISHAETESLRTFAPRARHNLRVEAVAAVAQSDTGEEVATSSKAATSSKDDYLAKLAKYVPAEVVTIASLGFAAFPTHGTEVWWWVAAGAVVNVLYLLSTAIVQPAAAPRPRWYFYLLSALAFVLWAMAVIAPVRHEAGLTGTHQAAQQAFVLALAAFALPMLDTLLGAFDGFVIRHPETVPAAN